MTTTTRNVFAWVHEQTGARRQFGEDLQGLLTWARSGDNPPEFHVELRTVTTTRTPWRRIEIEKPQYTCSYCELPATRVGAGQDGDFYCDDHINRAHSKPSPIGED